ncbi:RsmB/NOP family class I SAM-dependent RNA methyltransferase [Mycetocola zhadangensis]|uniref:rRNA small subunit methyltransferase B n=1 Tax=Mycetocola zhadangensis TaxID=1164595 RepID=A0A3L7JCB0_9MICO|nr:transcription antitermination factor NusB [Mycetocola zhadangensis]RLQ86132.1 rRNA small subunit methyltransferase B [Mycetocola zhadangensis]GGE88641.1 putative Fmu protein (SUN protein) [Mycetocola zhadangensis]
MNSAPPSSAQVQPARRVAFDVISAVSRDDAYANLLLPTLISRQALNTADAGLATELTYGTLRMRGYYDRVIAMAANRPVTDIDPDILDVLRLGAHQLLATRVAPHAAVNESVALARSVGSRSAVGFTNGVLRTLSRSTPEEWKERVLATTKTADDRLATEHAHPAWIVRAFRQALAAEGRPDELEALLAADNIAPRVNLIALPGLATPPNDAELNSHSPFGFVLASGDPDAAIRHESGRLRVQDEGSQIAALALSRAKPIADRERWLDLCAGPGGKTALLGAEAALSGAVVTANEVVPARAELVRRAVAPVPGDIQVTELDGTLVGELHPESFDRILVDAPCTGLGALRRRPEARWRKTAKDVGDLTKLQQSLLLSAFAALKPGGVLAYVTCSPHLAESRGVVLDSLRRLGDAAELLDTAAVVQNVVREPVDLGEQQTERAGTTVQLWPHRHGTDAMFIALLTKV